MSPFARSDRAGELRAMNSADEHVIAELYKRPREKLRVQLREHNGAVRCDVRVFVMASAGRWRPTRHGITLEPGRLTELIAALHLAQTEASRTGRDG